MKIVTKRSKERDPDDSLFGLLTAYKANSSYVRVLLNDKSKKIIFQMTDNPRFFPSLDSVELEDFRLITRSEMNVNRLFIKYLSPLHIIQFAGENINVKLTPKSVKITNRLLEKEGKYFQIEIPQRYLSSLVLSIRKLVTLTPQKKYEIIEKYLANTTKPEAQE
jgi:hypothetical protein